MPWGWRSRICHLGGVLDQQREIDQIYRRRNNINLFCECNSEPKLYYSLLALDNFKKEKEE